MIEKLDKERENVKNEAKVKKERKIKGRTEAGCNEEKERKERMKEEKRKMRKKINEWMNAKRRRKI